MTEAELESDPTPDTSIENVDFDEFVDDLRRWRRHADQDEKADDAHFLAMFVDIGEVMKSVNDRLDS